MHRVRTLLTVSLFFLTAGVSTASAPSDGDRTFAAVRGDRIALLRLDEEGVIGDAEAVRPDFPVASGSRAAYAAFGGRRHLYYVRADGAIGHLVAARDGTGWTDDGRVVASGREPWLLVDGSGVPRLLYVSGASLLAVRIGPETGRVAIPLEASVLGPPGPFAAVSRGSAGWVLRQTGGFIVAAPGLAEPSIAPVPIGLAPPDWRPLGLVPWGDLDAVIEAGPIASPLLWSGEGAPLLDDRGTLGAWIGGSPDPDVVPGPWRHRVDHDPPGWIRFDPSGRIEIPGADVRWRLDGADLLLTWRSPPAPGGAWEDRCVLSADGTRYLGRNQIGNLIRGSTDFADDGIVASAPHPVARLPERVEAPDGRLTLYADFADVRGERVALYLVNRTEEPVTVPTQDGDAYVKLEGRGEDGRFERAQTHLDSDCGNSYLVMPELPPGHFFRVLGLYPGTGEERTVRYRIHSGLELVSNAGPGRVDPVEIEVCRGDRMAIDEGSFEEVAAIALGDRKILAEDGRELRQRAVRRLPWFPDSDWRRVLGILVDDPDAEIRTLASRLLDGK